MHDLSLAWLAGTTGGQIFQQGGTSCPTRMTSVCRHSAATPYCRRSSERTSLQLTPPASALYTLAPLTAPCAYTVRYITSLNMSSFHICHMQYRCASFRGDPVLQILNPKFARTSCLPTSPASFACTSSADGMVRMYGELESCSPYPLRLACVSRLPTSSLKLYLHTGELSPWTAIPLESNYHARVVSDVRKSFRPDHDSDL